MPLIKLTDEQFQVAIAEYLMLHLPGDLIACVAAGLLDTAAELRLRPDLLSMETAMHHSNLGYYLRDMAQGAARTEALLLRRFCVPTQVT